MEKYGMLTTFISELSTNEITSIDFKFYNTFAPKNIGYSMFESDNLKCQKVSSIHVYSISTWEN